MSLFVASFPRFGVKSTERIAVVRGV